jgi:hypothetical protein
MLLAMVGLLSAAILVVVFAAAAAASVWVAARLYRARGSGR